jgi:hypothetical protein
LRLVREFVAEIRQRASPPFPGGLHFGYVPTVHYWVVPS